MVETVLDVLLVVILALMVFKPGGVRIEALGVIVAAGATVPT